MTPRMLVFTEGAHMVTFLVLYDTPHDPVAFDCHYHVVHIPLTTRVQGTLRGTTMVMTDRDDGGER